MERTEYIGGPAIVKIGTKLIYTKEDITVTPEINYTQNETTFHGKTSKHLDTVQHTITVAPAAMVTADLLALLFGDYANLQVGSRLYGSSPNDIVIWTKAGKEHTYEIGALTSFCGLAFSPTMPLFDGSATFTAIGDCNETIDTAGHFAKYADVVFNDASYDDSKEFQLVYDASWGAAPFDAIETEAGFKIAFSLELEDKINNSNGIYEKIVTGFGVTANFTPIGITESDILTARGIQGAGAGRGKKTPTNDLILTTSIEGDPYFKLFNCAIMASPSTHGKTANNMGEVQLEAQRTFSAGVVQPLFEIGLTPAA